MREQEGVDDDHQLDRGNHEEGLRREDDHEESGHHHKEDVQKEDGRWCCSGGVTVTYSVTARRAALGRPQHFGEGAPGRWSPSPNDVGLFPWNKAPALDCLLRRIVGRASGPPEELEESLRPRSYIGTRPGLQVGPPRAILSSQKINPFGEKRSSH